MPNFILNINSATEDLMLEDASVGCCLLNSEIEPMALKRLVHRVMTADKICLLYGKNAADLQQSTGADGILADLSKSENIKKDMENLRRQIKNGVLGVISRNRRHEAMIVSENEPDFIVFRVWKEGGEQTLELASWYEEFFLLQMAIMPQDNEVDFARYNADILILTPEQYKIFVAKK